jgi:hypothetical protein
MSLWLRRSAATMTNVTEFFDTPVGRRIVEKAAQMMNPSSAFQNG